MSDRVEIGMQKPTAEQIAFTEAIIAIVLNGPAPDWGRNIIKVVQQYEEFRNQQIVELQARLVEALAWSVKPSFAVGKCSSCGGILLAGYGHSCPRAAARSRKND